MANFAASALVAAQTLFNENVVNRSEFRLPDHASLKIAQVSGLHNPSLENVKLSKQRTVNAYFPIRQAATNATTRPALHTGDRGDSSSATYTWSVFTETFSISLNQAQNNVMNFAQMFAATKANALLNIINRADAWFLAQLLADKTAINVAAINGAFNATDDVYEVNASYKDYFFSEVSAMMQQNLYQGTLVGIVDAKGNELARRVGNQGAGNATNTSYTLLGYDAIVPTTRQILDPASFAASGIFFNPGLVSVVPWVQEDYRKSVDMNLAMTSVVGDRGQFTIPQLPGINFMEKYYSTQADGSSNQGTTDDVVIQGLLSLEVAYASAKLSDVRGSDDSVVYVAGALNV